MSKFNDDFDEFDDEQANYVTLNDENGNEILLEFIDIIAYNEKEYVIFLPADDETEENDGESEEVIILEVKESDDSEIAEYLSVDDESILNEVFELFKKKYKNEFNFE